MKTNPQADELIKYQSFSSILTYYTLSNLFTLKVNIVYTIFSCQEKSNNVRIFIKCVVLFSNALT